MFVCIQKNIMGTVLVFIQRYITGCRTLVHRPLLLHHPLLNHSLLLHRLLPLTLSTSFSSHSVSQLASPTSNPPHLLLPSCLSCLHLHLNTTVLLSHHTSIDFLLTPRRSRFTLLHLPFLFSFLAFCGNMHTNPGPPALPSFSLCTYSIRSLL